MTTPQDNLTRLATFIAEAEEVRGACCTLGHDDDSYDAGRLHDEAVAVRRALEACDLESLAEALADSFVDKDNVADWLEEAQRQLDGLSSW